MSTASTPIAIVGLGAVLPGAASASALWPIVERGQDMARDVDASRWVLPPDVAHVPGPPKPDRVCAGRAGLVDADVVLNFEGLELDSEFVGTLDRSVHLLLHAGAEAWRSSSVEDVDRRRAGVIVGNIVLPTDGASSLSDWIVGAQLERRLFAQAGQSAPMLVAAAPSAWNRWVAGLPAGLLAQSLNFGGEHLALDAACASSLFALQLAAGALQRGEADFMLAGGLSRPSSLYTQMGFSQLGALSPSGRCSPFDRRGDGLVVGEGAAVVALKRLDDARRHGDRIWAVIRGIGLSNDVDGNLLAPSSEGQLRAMRAAYDEAGWMPGDVDLIECHATGTPVGDAVEFASIQALCDPALKRRPRLGAVKANVGHLLTGAGAVALLKTVLAMERAVIPPVANYAQPSARIEIARVEIPTAPTSWPTGRARRAAVSGFGFGGTNAHVLLEHDDGVAGRSIQVQVPRASPHIAIVGMGAHVGRWESLTAVRERLFGERTETPHPKQSFGDLDDAPRGWFIDALQVPLGVFRIPPKELAALLPQQLLALLVARQALADVKSGPPEGPRVGTFVGVELDFGTTDYHLRWVVRARAPGWAAALNRPSTGPQFEQWVDALCDTLGPALDADRTMGGLASVAASRIAREFRFGGPSYTVSTEDTSGMSALLVAMRSLAADEIDAAYVGAVDLGGDVRAFVAQAASRPTSPAATPLDALSEGVGVGEGAVGLVLKRLDDARRDGDRVYAVLEGAASASGGGVPRLGPDVDALTRSARLAHEKSGGRAIGLVDVGAIGWPQRDVAALRALQSIADGAPRTATSARFGDTGAVAGLLAVLASALRVHHRLLEPVTGLGQPLQGVGRPLQGVQPWVVDEGQPRRVLIGSGSITGHAAHVVLGQADGQPWAPEPREALFVVEADDAPGLDAGLRRLLAVASDTQQATIETLARGWDRERGRQPQATCAVAIVAESSGQLAALCRNAVEDLTAHGDAARRAPSRVFHAARPLGPGAEIAFVFPGSGSHFPGMGRSIAVAVPEILWEQPAQVRSLAGQLRPQLAWNATQAEMDADPRGLILAQVSIGVLGSAALQRFGVKPDAVLGYSLGETTGLFALGAWRDRDGMLARVFDSPLFTDVLAGPCRAAAQAWGLASNETVHWTLGVVEATRARIDAALAGRDRVYRLIVNTPHECVIGGDATAVGELVETLGVPFHALPGVTTVHCEVVRAVRDEYAALHRLATTPPPGVRFYSGAWGRAYAVAEDTAADSVTDQAIVGVDFPKVVRQAYDDGARIFIEIGPGASCTRMIAEILGDRPFAAQSICGVGVQGRAGLLRGLATLLAHRVPLDLDPLFVGYDEPGLAAPQRVLDLPVGRRALGPLPALPEVSTPNRDAAKPGVPPWRPLGPAAATAAAHDAFLALSQAVMGLATAELGREQRLTAELPRSLDRQQCLTFARGRIGDVLGPTFAEVDAFPTRVRLPDEPLMLVDRILQIEGEPGSMTSGRVVTEHDVRGGHWYLDAGRIPTCIAVEAGQADLFLSAFLGIDAQTRGLAVYRLLDATVTFHDALPVVGATIHYDIRIERFFRQGQTWLFRFGFDATVDGVPLMTMRDGCAGFFSEAELAAGKGVVDARLAHAKPRPSTDPSERPCFIPSSTRALDDAQLDALRAGDLTTAFGDAFGRLPVRNPLTIPGGAMRLVHRITELDRDGGTHGLGFVRGEADIDPDDWFITCHFVDDPVMPGTLMYECCLHTLRVFLLSLGWVGEADDVAFEPKLGVGSRLKCRGQVLQQTKRVVYEVTMRQFGDAPEPWVICDASMFADGKRIVDIEDMSIRMTGTSARRLAAQAGAGRPRGYDKASLEAFAYGKPSDAFGAPYEPFDGARKIARLPGAPFQFIDRVLEVQGAPFEMTAGAHCRAEVDRDTWAWTLQANRQDELAFAVLLEIGLQACGWLAAYVGSALTAEVDLKFRNLGGKAILHRAVALGEPTLRMDAALTSVSSSGGMIIQHFDFAVKGLAGDPIYTGTTYFGFFSAAALADQVGIRDAALLVPSPQQRAGATAFDLSGAAPFPAPEFRMVDRIEALATEGGPHGLGFVVGAIDVDPRAWFFRAHFHEDPVWPGSLGLEAFLQLLKVFAVDRWQLGPDAVFATFPLAHAHEWVYRGQIVPSCGRVVVQAAIVEIDDAQRRVVADGFVIVDGRPIYEMKRFAVEVPR